MYSWSPLSYALTSNHSLKLAISRSYLSSAFLSLSPLLHSPLPRFLFLLLLLKFISNRAVTVVLNQIRFTSLPKTLHCLPLHLEVYPNCTAACRTACAWQPPHVWTHIPFSPFPAVLRPTPAFPLFLTDYWGVPLSLLFPVPLPLVSSHNSDLSSGVTWLGRPPVTIS